MREPLLRESPGTGWVLQENGLLRAFWECLARVLTAVLGRGVLAAAGAALLISHRSPATEIWGGFKCLCVVCW